MTREECIAAHPSAQPLYVPMNILANDTQFVRRTCFLLAQVREGTISPATMALEIEKWTL